MNNQLTPNEFWNSEHRIPQKFYTVLSIYISANHDYAVGLQLKENGMLNWSATASYYSMIHSVRMLIFIVEGDFPKMHNTYEKLFEAKDGNILNKEIKCDWFNQELLDDTDVEILHPKTNLEKITQHYKTKLEFYNFDSHVKEIAKLTPYCKNLRNDCNYEALLIAHEYNHFVVEPAFRDLSNTMSQVALKYLNLALKCFEHYLLYDSSLSTNNLTYQYLTQHYIMSRVIEQLKKKIAHQNIINHLCRINRIFIYSGQNKFSNQVISDAKRLEEAFSFDIFTGKRSLMNKFKEKIKNLKEAL